MIARATITDIERFADMGRWFYFSCNIPGEFNKEHFIGAWRSILNNGKGIIVARWSDKFPVEAIGLILYPDMYTGAPSATVAFWYVSGSVGLESGHLLKKVQEIAIENGIKKINVSSLVSHRHFEMNRFLLGMGFVPCEVSFSKDI